MDGVPAEGVGRDGRDHGGIDAAGHAEHHRPEAVLARVVARPRDERAPDLLQVPDPLSHLCVLPALLARLRLDRVGGRLVPFHHHVAERAGHHRGRGRQVEVDGVDALDELRRAQQRLAVRGDHEGIPVEDEFVLGADHVDVGDGRAGLSGAALEQLQPHVVLVALVRRAVDVHHEPGAGLPGDAEGAALLPDVLADRQGHVHAVEAHDGEATARDEVPVLVEHPVVGQMVFEVGGDDPAAETEGGGVAGRRAGGRAVVVEVADDDAQLRQTDGPQVGGQFVDLRHGCLPERAPEDEVLRRVAGERHLRDRQQVRAARHGRVRCVEDPGAVSRQITHGEVDLGQCDPEQRHAPSLPDGHPPVGGRARRRTPEWPGRGRRKVNVT